MRAPLVMEWAVVFVAELLSSQTPSFIISVVAVPIVTPDPRSMARLPVRPVAFG